MIVTGIPSTRIGDVWPALWPLIQPAHARSDEKADLLAGIRARELTCWAIFDIDKVVAGIISKKLLEETSGELHAHVWLVGGSRLSSWIHDFLAIFIPWAKAEGCCAVTGSGRIGWSRMAARLGCERVEARNGFPTWKLAI